MLGRFDPRRQTAELLVAGASVDLGAIGKGYAAQRVRRAYSASGVRCGLLSLGGHILLAVGGRPDIGRWKIGIRHPRRPGEYVGAVAVQDASVSTSGDYEQYAETGGVRYHHVIDPVTGFPSQSGLVGATVVAKDPLEADVLSTAILVSGAAAARKLLGLARGKAGAILIDCDGCVSTVGWAACLFTPASGSLRAHGVSPPGVDP